MAGVYADECCEIGHVQDELRDGPLFEQGGIQLADCFGLDQIVSHVLGGTMKRGSPLLFATAEHDLETPGPGPCARN